MKEEEEEIRDRLEMKRRNSKKERGRSRKIESPERINRTTTTTTTIRGQERVEHTDKIVRRDEDHSPGISMWACKRCTLENPLQEATCLACGGSRYGGGG